MGNPHGLVHGKGGEQGAKAVTVQEEPLLITGGIAVSAEEKPATFHPARQSNCMYSCELKRNREKRRRLKSKWRMKNQNRFSQLYLEFRLVLQWLFLQYGISGNSFAHSFTRRNQENTYAFVVYLCSPSLITSNRYNSSDNTIDD